MLRIDDKKFSVTVNMYFSVLWDEERLVRNSYTSLVPMA